VRLLRLVCPLLVLLVLVACAPAGPVGLSDADRAAIQTVSQKWRDAAVAGDWAALGGCYASDALLLPPNHVAVEGREAIEDFFAGFPPVTEMTLRNLEVEGHGDLAYVRGIYTMTMAPEGQPPVQDNGKYLDIRRRQDDGSWLIVRDMYSSDEPVPAPGADDAATESAPMAE